MARRAQAPLAACLACAAALGALVVLAYAYGPSERLDARLLGKLAARGDTALGSLADGLAHLADPLPLLALLVVACAIAMLRGRPRDAAAAVAVVAGANVTTQVLKVLLTHPRSYPGAGYDLVVFSAFPSGHATAAASIVIAYLFVVPPRLRVPVALLGAGFFFAVGCSVVVLDWHYPSDVAGGLLVAAGWGFAVLAALRVLGPDGSGGAGRAPRLSDYDERAAIAVK